MAQQSIANETIVVNMHGLTGLKKVVISGTETILDLFNVDPVTGYFELFLSPTMKRLDRARTIGSYGIKDGANIYLLPVNRPKKFEPLEESLRKIWTMEHQQMIWPMEDQQMILAMEHQQMIWAMAKSASSEAAKTVLTDSK